jgi:squalene synthase HpnC
MPMKQTSIVDQAFDSCEKIAFRHYENFPVASLFIPKDKRKYVAAIYAFARTADDAADEEGLTNQARLQRLSRLEQQLHLCLEGNASDPVFIALGESVSRFDLPVVCFEQLLIAFRMDVEKKRYATWEEVLGYCSFSANPIGRLILQLFGYKGDDRLHASDAICTALQLTNFWQDLSIDLNRNRIYVPHDDLEQFGCTEADLLRHEYDRNFCRLMTFEIDRTELLFKEGKPLTDWVDRDLRLQLRLTWFGGMKILKKIRHINYDVFSHRPTISRWDKFLMMIEAIRRRGKRGGSTAGGTNSTQREA